MALIFDQDQKDTIAAIATGRSEAGIGIVRISGSDADNILNKIYRTPKGRMKSVWKPNTIHYGMIVDPDSGEMIDEVLVSWLKAPHSYTTEDTAEINTHGGIYLLERVLDAVLRAGARPAEPGEFTKRAFLGGRMDLSEAGAVMDLIHSQNEFARRNSLRQLQGSVSSKVKDLRKKILYEIAFIESALDDPENYSLDGYPGRLSEVCEDILRELREILNRSENGKLLQEGIKTVIVGKPNAGKSSLLNFLTGEDRAIVTSIAGTTRDTLSETVRLGDVILHITDTAGIHETQDVVESIGVERAKKEIETAQLILFITDLSSGITKEDEEIANLVQKELNLGKSCILIQNKEDLEERKPTEQNNEQNNERNEVQDDTHTADECKEKEFLQNLQAQERVVSVKLSLLKGSGTNQLKEAVLKLFHLGEIMDSNELFLTEEHQKVFIRNTIHSLELTKNSIQKGLSEDFYSIDLRNAYSQLGKMIGEEVEDDLVEEIFSRFCLGK
jgi:tRNA modification GTPase